jgi:predicted RNA binding protein YcfA (HicA-like mRNA interferase family)
MKLPRDLSGGDVVKALRRLVFEFARQTGSHAILKKNSCTVVVPQHRRSGWSHHRGTEESSLKEIGWHSTSFMLMLIEPSLDISP